MPANPRWYPTELPALAQSSSSTSALEASVRSLQNDARIAAIRQALGRRSSGVIAAAQQNTGSIVIGSLMPLVIDPVTRSQPATQTVASVGTAGYVVGSSQDATARNTNRITFSTDAVASIGDVVTLLRRTRGSASSLTRGILAGGSPTTNQNDGRTELEEFIYSTETATVLPSTLSYGAFQGAQGDIPGGFASRRHAFFVSKNYFLIDRYDFDLKSISRMGVASRQVHHVSSVATPSSGYSFADRAYGTGGQILELTFATESVRQLTSPLPEVSGEGRQTLGNGDGRIYLFGCGANAGVGVANSYRYTVSTGAAAAVASLPSATVNAARVGNSTQGYLCGGTSGPWHYWNSYYFIGAGLSTVHKFVYGTEAISVNANALTSARSHPAGVSNYAGAFFGQ